MASSINRAKSKNKKDSIQTKWEVQKEDEKKKDIGTEKPNKWTEKGILDWKTTLDERPVFPQGSYMNEKVSINHRGHRTSMEENYVYNQWMLEGVEKMKASYVIHGKKIIDPLQRMLQISLTDQAIYCSPYIQRKF